MKTICYIDGFNLYHRALRGTNNKWLDIQALMSITAPDDSNIIAINYYTARVSGKLDPKSPINQHSYLRALETLDKVKIHYGNFLTTKKWIGLAKPPQFKPEAKIENGIEPDVVYVIKTEEKGSDVNLGVHLVRDAAMKKMDVAIILTNDTDLAEAMKIAREEFGIKVILLSPVRKSSATLVKNADQLRHFENYLSPAQLPEQITLANGKTIKKPNGW